MRILLIFIGFIALYVILTIGILHLAWHHACRKELGKHRQGYSSNGRREYQMKVVRIEKNLFTYTILGAGVGTMPESGDVLYLTDRDFRRTVLVRNVHVSPVAGHDFMSVKLRTFGHLPGKMLGICETVFMTNMRERTQIPEQKDFELSSIHYPLIIGHTLREKLKSHFLMICGFLELVFFAVWVIVEKTVWDWRALLLLILGSQFISFGWVIARDTRKMKIRVDADGSMTVRNGKLHQTFRIEELRWGTKETDGKKDFRTLVLYTPDQKSIGELKDTEEGYQALYGLLTGLQKQKGREYFHRMVLEKQWILPLRDGQPLTEKAENGTDMLVITDSPLRLTRTTEGLRFREISLEEAVQMTEQFTVYSAIAMKFEVRQNGSARFARYVLNPKNISSILPDRDPVSKEQEASADSPEEEERSGKKDTGNAEIRESE